MKFKGKENASFLYKDFHCVDVEKCVLGEQTITTIFIRDAYCVYYLNDIIPIALSNISGWLSDKITIYISGQRFDYCGFVDDKDGTLKIITDHKKNIIKTVIPCTFIFYRCTFFRCTVVGLNNSEDCLFVDTDGAKADFISCPSDGDFIGWKVCDRSLVKLKIPKESRRSSGESIKSRCEFADVLAIYNIPLSPYAKPYPMRMVTNTHWKTKALYEVGERVFADSFDDSKEKICTHGIHFFIDKNKALSLLVRPSLVNYVAKQIEALEYKESLNK